LFLLGIFTGFLTDFLLGDKAISRSKCQQEFELHEEDVCHCFPWGHIKKQWVHCSVARGVLSVALVLFLFGILSGKLGPSTWNWIRITFLLVSGVALFIVSTVPEHFLEEHLWEHIAKIHVPRVFFWTFAALFLMHILIDQLHLEGWIQQLASSVVQDGHGMLPMLAESRLDFFKIKGINLFVGLCVGLTGYLTGW
jgi:hypothetical protein